MTNIGERIGNIFYQRHARISNDRKVIGLEPRIGNGSRNFFSVLINTRIKCNFDISSSDRQTRIFLRALSDSPLCGNDPRPFSNRALTAISPGLGTSLVTIFLEISQDSREMRVNFSSNFHSTVFFRSIRKVVSSSTYSSQISTYTLRFQSHPFILKESKGSNFTKCLRFSSEELWMKRYCSIFNLRISHTIEISFSIARKIKYRAERDRQR